jgi:hypothetical protein
LIPFSNFSNNICYNEFSIENGIYYFSPFSLLFYPKVLQRIPLVGLEETEASFSPSGNKDKRGNTWQHRGVK